MCVVPMEHKLLPARMASRRISKSYRVPFLADHSLQLVERVCRFQISSIHAYHQLVIVDEANAHEQSSILVHGLGDGMPQDIGIMQNEPKAIGPPQSDAPQSKTKA